ncbi:MAG: PAS domain-containing protein [Patescibacteria group bacterium]|nr:PAS domain-containing protein [Patescibacteria group bacterium]
MTDNTNKGVHGIYLSAEALDNLPFGAYVIDKSGIIQFFNKEMARISGVNDSGKIIGQNVNEIPGYDRYGLLTFVKRGLGGKPFRIKGIEYVSHIGKKKSFRDYYGIPIKDEECEVEQILCIVEDVTRQRDLENQVVNDLEQKEQLIKEIKLRVAEDMGRIDKVLNSTKNFIRSRFDIKNKKK